MVSSQLITLAPNAKLAAMGVAEVANKLLHVNTGLFHAPEGGVIRQAGTTIVVSLPLVRFALSHSFFAADTKCVHLQAYACYMVEAEVPLLPGLTTVAGVMVGGTWVNAAGGVAIPQFALPAHTDVRVLPLPDSTLTVKALKTVLKTRLQISLPVRIRVRIRVRVRVRVRVSVHQGSPFQGLINKNDIKRTTHT
jgi:hypothetical protein